MKLLALMTLLAGCSTQADDYPVLPGPVAAPPVISDSGMVKGQACVVTDPRNLTSCATTGASGLTVRLGDQIATTDASGSFAIAAPATTGTGGGPSPATMLGVTGPGVVPTQLALPSTPGAMSVPLLKADLFAQMMAANGVVLSSGSGSILGSVARGGIPVTGVTVTSTPSPAFGPLFDGSTPTSWTLDGTGARGVWWIPGVAIGPARVTLRDLATSGETTVDGVQVIDSGITIMDAILP
jgi:hypothetical protein